MTLRYAGLKVDLVLDTGACSVVREAITNSKGSKGMGC